MSEDDIDTDAVDVAADIADLFHKGRVTTAIVEERDEIPSPDAFLVELLKAHGNDLSAGDNDDFDIPGFQ